MDEPAGRREAAYLRRLTGKERRYDAERPWWMTFGRPLFGFLVVLVSSVLAGTDWVPFWIIVFPSIAVVGLVDYVFAHRWDKRHRVL